METGWDPGNPDLRKIIITSGQSLQALSEVKFQVFTLTAIWSWLFFHSFLYHILFPFTHGLHFLLNFGQLGLKLQLTYTFNTLHKLGILYNYRHIYFYELIIDRNIMANKVNDTNLQQQPASFNTVSFKKHTEFVCIKQSGNTWNNENIVLRQLKFIRSYPWKLFSYWPFCEILFCSCLVYH